MARGGFFSKLFFVLGIFLLFLGIVLGFLGYTLYNEVRHFQDVWPTTEKAVLLRDKGSFLVGIAGTFKEGDMPHILSDTEKAELLHHLENYQFALIIEKDAFSSLRGEIRYAGIKLPVEQAKILLFASHPKETFGSLLSGKSLPFLSDDQLRGVLFALLIEEAIRQDPFFLITQYRAGHLTILPEQFLFSLFKYTPVYETLKKQLSST